MPMRRMVPWGMGLYLVVGAAFPARADSRISFEVGGLVTYSPVEMSSSGRAASGIRQANTASPAAQSARMPSDMVVGVDVRPTFSLAGGLRIAVGVRAGVLGGIDAEGLASRSDLTLFGGDVSVGYQRWVGRRFLPYAEARMGFNSYTGSSSRENLTQLRADAVVGARLYVNRAWFLAGSAFAGWGDRYGGTVALGFDVIHFQHRGVLP